MTAKNVKWTEMFCLLESRIGFSDSCNKCLLNNLMKNIYVYSSLFSVVSVSQYRQSTTIVCANTNITNTEEAV